MTSLVDLGKRLLEASKKGHADEVSMLMTSGAPFTTDWLGTSPLHLAAQYGHTTTAEVLLRAGVSRDARTKVDRTPIHLAAQHGHLAIVDLLIAGGASVNHTDMLNMTPLHWACESGHVEIAKLLLRNGADMDIESKFKQTPLDIARNKGFTEIVNILMAEETTDRSQGIKRQSHTSLTLGSIKKRQKTRKFPMTAGSWTGSDTPSPMNTGMPVLRTHSETMAPLVSAAALAISSEEKYLGKSVKQEPTSSQDSSVLDALATLATATIHQTAGTPSAVTNSIPLAMSTGPKQNVTLAPLTIPPTTPNPLLNNITPITPPMWPALAPLQSPLAALSAISALTSSPAQPSPLNIPMHQLPIAVPLGFNSQSGTTTSNQLFITQVPIGGQQTVTAPSSQSTVTVSSITASAVSSVVDQSSTSADSSLTNTQPTTYLVPIMGGPAGQGHLFLTTPDGTPQLLLDSSHFNQHATNLESTQDKNTGQQNSQENLFQVQLSPAILQQPGQTSLDPQVARQNVVHSILAQPLHIAGQVPGQLPQIQMALAQVVPNQSEAQTQVGTNTQNTPSQVLIQAVPLNAAQQEQTPVSQTQTAQQLTTEQLPATHQQLLQQLLQGQGGPVQVTEVIQNQSPASTTQPNSQSQLVTSHLPATAALQNLINQNYPGVSGAQSSQAQQQKVFVDLQKLVETQEREARTRRELEARLEEARRDNRKFQTELQQAQKEAESYKGRLQAIHKDKDNPDEESPVVGVSGVSPENSGEQLARQLFIQPGTLEGLGPGSVSVMATDAVDMLSQVAQESSSVAQVVVAETVVDEGDITCGVPSDHDQSK